MIALSSLVYSTYLAFFPTRSKFLAAYILVGSTLLSGTYLVVSTDANMVRACTTGLIYLSVASFILVIAHRKLPATVTDYTA